MGIYTKTISISFKSRLSFKLDYIISTTFSFLALVLQISIWQSLFSARNGASLAGVELNDMIAYNIIAAFSGGITACRVMNEINDMVLHGEIAQRLLLPLGFRRHMLFSSVATNIFWTIYSIIPPCIIAVIVYGFKFNFKLINFGLFIVSVLLAFFLNFCLNFILGLVVFWMKNAFFLDWMVDAFRSLFSGRFVPMWFFPGWLNSLSLFIPFRYIIFEPVSILLGKYSADRAVIVIIMQIIWIGVLWLIGDIVWKKAQKIVFSQGG